jgi:hypothetical protein
MPIWLATKEEVENWQLDLMKISAICLTFWENGLDLSADWMHAFCMALLQGESFPVK